MAKTNILFSLHTFLQAKLHALDGSARHVTLLNAMSVQREQRAAIMMEWPCSQVGNGPAVGAAPSLHQMEGTRSWAIMWAAVGLSLPLYFFPLVSRAHLLAPCWTSVVISRHFTAKRHRVHGDNSFCRTQREKKKWNPAVVMVGSCVKLVWWRYLTLCIWWCFLSSFSTCGGKKNKKKKRRKRGEVEKKVILYDWLHSFSHFIKQGKKTAD